jgi:hypothetical protein
LLTLLHVLPFSAPLSERRHCNKHPSCCGQQQLRAATLSMDAATRPVLALVAAVAVVMVAAVAAAVVVPAKYES